MTRTFRQYLHETSEQGDIRVGVPLPLGAHQHGDGVNFALFSAMPRAYFWNFTTIPRTQFQTELSN